MNISATLIHVVNRTQNVLCHFLLLFSRLQMYCANYLWKTAVSNADIHLARHMSYITQHCLKTWLEHDQPVHLYISAVLFSFFFFHRDCSVLAPILMLFYCHWHVKKMTVFTSNLIDIYIWLFTVVSRCDRNSQASRVCLRNCNSHCHCISLNLLQESMAWSVLNFHISQICFILSFAQSILFFG